MGISVNLNYPEVQPNVGDILKNTPNFVAFLGIPEGYFYRILLYMPLYYNFFINCGYLYYNVEKWKKVGKSGKSSGIDP